jgi:adenosine deaminase
LLGLRWLLLRSRIGIRSRRWSLLRRPWLLNTMLRLVVIESDFARDLARSILEFANALTQAAGNLRNAFRSEKKEDDEKDDEYFGYSRHAHDRAGQKNGGRGNSTAMFWRNVTVWTVFRKVRRPGRTPPSSLHCATLFTRPPSTVDTSSHILSLEAIRKWPKAELHCHLDGSLRLETMLDLAREQDKPQLLPDDTVEGLESVLKKIDDSETLEDYLAWFRYTIPLMQNYDALRRIAYELAEDCARENVRHLEVRYGPILHTEDGLSLEEVNDAVLAGLEDARQDFGISTGVIICGLRDRFESASLRQAELAVAYRKRGVVGFDLAGGEAGNPPKHHLHAFYYARNALVNLTIHAGESWGPDSIRQALFFCGAHRIGHGTTLRQDPDLLAYFVDHQIPLEICPTSNVQTHVVPSIEAHPLTEYVRAGVPVTINTDNRLFSRTTVSDELHRIHTQCGITVEELVQITLNGFRYAFLPHEERLTLLDEARDWFSDRSNLS